METVVGYLYVAAAVLFVLSLKWMNEVGTARMGNWAGCAGMMLAIAATLMAFDIRRMDLVVIAVAVGAAIGVPISLKLPMTAVPQRTAMSHAFGSLAVALVGTAEYLQRLPDISGFAMIVLAVEMTLGYLTFTGSTIAFLKLQEMIPGRPMIYRGRNIVSGLLIAAIAAMILALVVGPRNPVFLPVLIVSALVFGLLLVMGIGGADMPTVIAILNSYAGLSAAAPGLRFEQPVADRGRHAGRRVGIHSRHPDVQGDESFLRQRAVRRVRRERQRRDGGYRQQPNRSAWKMPI